MKALILHSGHGANPVEAQLCQTLHQLLVATQWEVETVLLREGRVG